LNLALNENSAAAAVCNRRVLIAGGSGFIGLAIATHLNSLGAEVILLSLTSPAAGPWRHVVWDGRSPGAWQQSPEGPAGCSTWLVELSTASKRLIIRMKCCDHGLSRREHWEQRCGI